MSQKGCFEYPEGHRRNSGGQYRISKEIIEKMLNFIRAGAYIETAAISSGVSKQTYYNWMRMANNAIDLRKKEPGALLSKEQKLAIKLLDSVEKAKAEAEIADVLTISLASKRNWQAAAWRLERKFPDRWGRKDVVKQELTGAGGGPVKVENKVEATVTEVDLKKDYTPEEAKRLLKRHHDRIFGIPTIDPIITGEKDVPAADDGAGNGAGETGAPASDTVNGSTA